MATYAKSMGPAEASAGPRRTQLIGLLWFAALLAICYAPVIHLLVRQWANDEDMGHGFFVPIIAGYIAWQRRHELMAIVPKPNYWGVLILLWSAFQMMLGTLGAELFLARTSLIIAIIGSILLVRGTQTLKKLAFPIFLLCFMIPIPAIIYARITLPLQIFASRMAEMLLGLLGIPVLRDGNVLELASQKLSVVEACSGIRSLLSLSFLSLVYAYFFDKKAWMRGVLLLATIPIAIMVNAARVTITGVLSEIRTDLAQGVFHTFEGWVMFVIALIILIGVHKLINTIYDAFKKASRAREAVTR